jgi:hypothetical protein
MEAPFPHRLCDRLTEILLYLMVIFSPWAFGTTQEWAVWTMNYAGFTVGALLVAKWFFRRKYNYRPPRWSDPREPHAESSRRRSAARWATIVDAAMVAATVLIVGFCLVSAINAKATYNSTSQLFNFHAKSIPWLPHSFASGDTWLAFWSSLALACVFWGARDWLLCKEPREVEDETEEENRIVKRRGAWVPARLRHLLWVISINGALLGIEGIFQRLAHSDKLLWLVQPRINQNCEAQFASYAYRSNAAQLFNLIWPVCLGFFLTLQRTGQYQIRRAGHAGAGAHYALLFAASVMAMCPLIALSRASAVVGGAMLLISMGWFFISDWRGGWWIKSIVTIALLGIVYLGLDIGLGDLLKRMSELKVNLVQREKIYEQTMPIIREHPMFGTGPGTFATVYQLYLTSTEDIWFAQVHNDYLETLATFGWVGSGIIIFAFVLVLARPFIAHGIRLGLGLNTFILIATAGLLAQARFDFPFQIYSILFLFVLLSSISTCVVRRG